MTSSGIASAARTPAVDDAPTVHIEPEAGGSVDVQRLPGGSALARDVCAVPPVERTVVHVLRCALRLAADDAHAADLIWAVVNDASYVPGAARRDLARLVQSDTFDDVMRIVEGVASARPLPPSAAAASRPRQCPLRALTACFGSGR